MKPAHNEHLFIDAIKDGYFRIDDDGRIWRIAKRVNQYKTFVKIIPKEIITTTREGYVQINLRVNGKKYNCYAHRIVWIHFNGKIPENKEINHKNGIKIYNSPENLELVTNPENEKHAYKIGLKYGQKGEKHGMAKLTEIDIKEIRLRYSNGETLKEIANDFNISFQHVSSIVNRKTWAHID